jgi:hypothetical protein
MVREADRQRDGTGEELRMRNFRKIARWGQSVCKYCGWTGGYHPPGCPGEPKG